MRRFLLAALFGGAAVLLVLWVSRGDGLPGDPANHLAPPGRQERSSSARTTLEPPESLARPPSTAGSRIRANSASADDWNAGISADELADAVWVVGRVDLPAGTPADERVVVIARGRKFGHGDHYRAPVDAEGAFRVAFVERKISVRLELEARYLDLRSPLKFKLADVPDPLVLRPALGGRIAGRLYLPGGIKGTPRDFAGMPPTVLFERDIVGSDFGRDTFQVSLDDQLEFDFGPVLPGLQHRAEIEAPGYPPLGASGFAVEAGQTHWLDLTLVEGVSFSGRIVDESGSGIEGVSLRLAKVRAFGAMVRDAVYTSSGGDGGFQTTSRPGRLMLEASLAGYRTATLDLGERAPGMDMSDLLMTLEVGDSIRGVASWPDGSPVIGGYVTVLDGDGSDASVDAGEAPDWRPGVRTSPDGAFVLVGLEDRPTPFVVAVEAARSESDAASWAWQRDVSIGDELSLVMAPGATITGRVVDDRGRAPLAYSIDLVPMEDRDQPPLVSEAIHETFRSKDGGFTMPSVPPGRWWVFARASGYGLSNLESCTVPLAQRMELRLARCGRIRGTVVDGDGAPVSGATVVSALSNARRTPPFQYRALDPEATSRTDGSFDLSGLGPGSVKLLALLPGMAGMGAGEWATFELTPGQELTDVELRLLRPGGIEGRLHERFGDLSNRYIELGQVFDGQPRGKNMTRTDGAGHFRYEGLRQGEYELRVSSGYEDRGTLFAMPLRVSVESGTAVQVVLGAPSEASLPVEGRVVWAGGEGVPDLGVELRVAGEDRGARLRTRTDGNGGFRFERLEPGAYDVDLNGASTRMGAFRVLVPSDSSLDVFPMNLVLPRGSIAGAIRMPSSSERGLTVQLSARDDQEGFGGPRSVHLSKPWQFLFEALPDGRYDLRASHPSDALSAGLARVTILDGQVVSDIDLWIGPGGSVSGLFLGESGEPLVMGSIWILSEEGVYLSGRPDASASIDGAFEVTGIPPGNCTVIGVSDGKQVNEPAMVRAGQNTEVVLRRSKE